MIEENIYFVNSLEVNKRERVIKVRETKMLPLFATKLFAK